MVANIFAVICHNACSTLYDAWARGVYLDTHLRCVDTFTDIWQRDPRTEKKIKRKAIAVSRFIQTDYYYLAFSVTRAGHA